jgi:hypothetical protein
MGKRLLEHEAIRGRGHCTPTFDIGGSADVGKGN